MKRKALFATCASAILILASCGNGINTISSDDVNNPATASGDYDEDKMPKIEFETQNYDFGTITDGDHVKYSFKFKNTGKSNLIISDASASCGCTIPEKPDEPIPPGGENKIDIDFNSSGKGSETEVVKTIVVITNTNPNKMSLRIHGFVKKR